MPDNPIEKSPISQYFEIKLNWALKNPTLKNLQKMETF